MEDTGCCSKQYRSASSLYLISTLSMKYGIVMDRAVGAPGHEEDKNIKTMSCHSATPMRSASFAAEYGCLLQYHANHISNVLTSKS
eukprot:7788217-Ditylum_brightwellii.AAC.2